MIEIYESFLTLLQNDILFLYVCVCVLGLILGSFYNVVIIRLPIMLKSNWTKECYDFLDLSLPNKVKLQLKEKYNLIFPRSTCIHCDKSIKIRDNIPVISYMLLRGKCRNCKAKISIRYPLVELLTMLLFLLCAHRYGASLQLCAALIFSSVLLISSFIDIDEMIIPDELSLGGLWFALFISLFSIFVSPADAIIGAIAGYISFFVVYWIFLLVTEKEGMGFGDFKLLAMIGAFGGWQILPFVIITSSLLGSIFGIITIIVHNQGKSIPMPFGPYIAISGYIGLLYGNEINTMYLNASGLYI